MATWNMLNFQNSNSPYADNLLSFHNYTFLMLIMITFTTMYMLYNIFSNKFMNRFMLKNHNIEIIWTVIPMMILLFICFPSLKTLYLIDEMWNPTLFTVKAIGHQWYWSYEYPDFFCIEFDSYMIKDFSINNFRLLDVDNRMIIPYKYPFRFLTTSMDVIHSWTIPSLGLKLDASPGRINQGNIYVKRPGVQYGQCSEICGANHSFMPIALEATTFYNFIMRLIEIMLMY